MRTHLRVKGDAINSYAGTTGVNLNCAGQIGTMSLSLTYNSSRKVSIYHDYFE